MIVIRQPFECRFNDEFYCWRERKSLRRSEMEQNTQSHTHVGKCMSTACIHGINGKLNLNYSMQRHAYTHSHTYIWRHNARKPIDCHYDAITNDHMLHVTMIFGYCTAVPSNCRSDISIFLVSILWLVYLFPLLLTLFIIQRLSLPPTSTLSHYHLSIAAYNANNL